MKSCSKLFALTLVCFALVACGKAAEEKHMESASKNLDLSGSRINTAAPDCAKRGEDRKYINGRGCTAAEWKAFNESQP